MLVKKSVFAAILLMIVLCAGIGCRSESAATGLSEVSGYSYPKEDGVSLEEFGQKKAAEHNVFCNMMTDGGAPAAVLNYHDCAEGRHYIVQTYFHETGDCFVEVRTAYKTEPVPLGSGDLSIHMIREYEAREQKDSPLLFDAAYSAANERLPQVFIRQFYKDDFPAGIIEPKLRGAVSDDRCAGLAADGWTLEELISLYRAGFDLLKGEITRRNGFDLAFIGYIDEGIFKTRAFLDGGDYYTMICAEAEAAKFQHITNALIDAVEKTGPQ